MALKIAITGNIASGKSQVENILRDLGYYVYDSDKIAHAVLDSITDFYGYDVFTEGKIDRKKLGQLVFSNPDLRQKLEKLTHPKVKREILDLFEKHKDDKFIFVSVPLLFETGFDNIFDKIILVYVDKDIQLKRLMQRNNLSEYEAMLRISVQDEQAEKVKHADFVIENNTSIDDLNEQIKKIVAKLL